MTLSACLLHWLWMLFQMNSMNLEISAPVPDVNAPVRMVHLVYQDAEDDVVAPESDPALTPGSSGCPPESLEGVAVPQSSSGSSLALGQKCLDQFMTGK